MKMKKENLKNLLKSKCESFVYIIKRKMFLKSSLEIIESK